MDNTLEKRIIELESLISFQEHTIDQLNQVMYNQQLQIDGISQQMTAVTSMMKSQNPEDKRTLEEERPPHY